MVGYFQDVDEDIVSEFFVLLHFLDPVRCGRGYAIMKASAIGGIFVGLVVIRNQDHPQPPN